MDNNSIYLDYAATTPVHPDVLAEMLPFFTEHFGNSGSSTHQHGWYSNNAIKKARKQIASAINCEETEVIFTSGATEAINLAIKGVFDLYRVKGKHLIISKTEHKAVIETAESLKKQGATISYIEVDENGKIDPKGFEDLIQPDTILAAVMWVNNETGVIQNVEHLAEIATKNKVPFLSDASQALGKVEINMANNQIGLLPISGHKIFGPKGVGALFVRRKNPRISLSPIITGGGQERKLRGGTLNTPGIVGFGKSVELASTNFSENLLKLSKIKDQYIHFFRKFNGIVNGEYDASPHILNVQIPNLKADQLIKLTRNLSYSLGSACTSETLDPSHVLTAMGQDKKSCFSSIRLSFSPYISNNDIEQSFTIFENAITQLTSEL